MDIKNKASLIEQTSFIFNEEDMLKRILRVVRRSIWSGLNNLAVYLVLREELKILI